jgi:hypothetical protein
MYIQFQSAKCLCLDKMLEDRILTQHLDPNMSQNEYDPHCFIDTI